MLPCELGLAASNGHIADVVSSFKIAFGKESSNLHLFTYLFTYLF